MHSFCLFSAKKNLALNFRTIGFSVCILTFIALSTFITTPEASYKGLDCGAIKVLVCVLKVFVIRGGPL